MLQEIDIQELIRYMDNTPNDFIVIVEGLDNGGSGDGREEYI